MTTTDNAAATLDTMESATGLPSRPPARRADPESRRPARAHGIRYLARASATVPSALTPEGLGEVLPCDFFGPQLRREMRRADRSGAPLSLVVFRLQDATQHAGDALRTVLVGNKRETDIVGQLGRGAMAVICTDTGSDGAARFIEKVDAHLAGVAYFAEPATYPNQLFEGLVASPGLPADQDRGILADASTPDGVGYALKRPLDVLGALLALLLLSPLMLVTALAVKLGSPGPVVYRQSRLGKGGRLFNFYKFRSMYVNRDDSIHREFVASLIKGDHSKVAQQNDATPVYKIKADPRVTPIGRFIRRTSLDELPQLFNVLRGEMSLVGPRPPLPYEAENYQSWHLRRVLEIRPGITGLWQVEGRSKVSFDEMVRMDLRYIRNCSLSLDLRLLLRTALVVFRCDGAT